MRKTFCFVATLALLAVAQAASATRVVLIAHNQRSGAGTGQPSTLRWSGCTTYTAHTACINPANAAFTAAGITPSTAVWDWDAATGVLSMTGTFNTASTIGSSGAGVASMVIGDKVTDLVIDTANNTTSAASYACGEGNFLAAVGAHGCANVSLGDDGLYNSSMAYNVGGDANCVQRTIGGDDTSTGDPRTLAESAGGGGCDAGDGAFLMYEVVQDNTATVGGQLVVSNNTDLFAAGVNYLTFQAVADAADDGPFSALESVALPIDVLDNDTLFTDPVTVTVTTLSAKGTAVVNGSPGPAAGITITYTAGAGQSGADSFVYQVTDGTSTDSATVTLNVLTGGANDDTASTTRNAAAFSINVGGNDSGFTDPVTITLETAPDQGGTATPPAAGAAATRAFTYNPGTKAAGTPTYTETFTYRITGANSLTATADVIVTVSNAVPVANDAPSLSISTQGSAPGSATVTLNAATFPGNNIGNTPSTVTATNGANGTTSVAGNVVTYTPSATFFAGTDTFTYTITDADPGTAETDTGTATVTIQDRSPAIANGAITTAQDTAAAPFALTVTLGNGSQAQHTVVTQSAAPTKGTCALAGTTVTYTPTAGQSGADSCSFSITDGDGDTGTGTLSITITPAPGGGGGGGGLLPGGGGALDGFGLALLAGAAWLGRRRRAGR